jgi:hypothetical protein
MKKTMRSGTGSKTKLTYREYCQFPDDGRRHEIIDGDHYVTPVPETNHQRVSRKIQLQLMLQVTPTFAHFQRFR